MKKTPTIFERDWLGDKSRVTREVNPECRWVFDGEGFATRKIDGTCCMMRDGVLYRRREIKSGDTPPPTWIACDADAKTKKVVRWVVVGDGPEDQFHREALGAASGYEDGTYELIGPKVQGNPERVTKHELVQHGFGLAGPIDVPRDFDALAAFFAEHDIEGVVFHHQDGRMAKIKARDFGVQRK